MRENEAPSYHDVHVTTARMKRTALSDLPFGYELTCNRVGGWTLWGPNQRALDRRIGPFPEPMPTTGPVQIAGEYGKGLRVDVGGVVICDSLNARATS